MTFKLLKRTSLVLTVIAGIGAASNAQAGFEWVQSTSPQTSPAPIASRSHSAPHTQSVPTIQIDQTRQRGASPAPNSQTFTPIANTDALFNAPAPTQSAQPGNVVIAKAEPIVIRPQIQPVAVQQSAPQRLPLVEFQGGTQTAQNNRRILIDPNPLGPKKAAAPILQKAPIAQANTFAKPQVQPQVSHNFGVVQGFGSDIPLALALSQIIPSNYAYSFRGTVNPGTRVSWSGGQPWNVVLGGVLKDLGLKAIVTNNTVIIAQDIAMLERFENAVPLLNFKVPGARLAQAPAALAPIIAAPLGQNNDLINIAGSNAGLKKKLHLTA